MKQFIYTLFILGNSLITYGQFKSDSRLVGGSLSINLPMTSENTKTTNFSLNPEYAVFKRDNQIVGIAGLVRFENSKTNGKTTQSSQSLGVTPYIQQLIPINSKFSLSMTGLAEISYTSATRVTSFGNNEDKTGSFSMAFSGRPGVLIGPFDRLLLRIDIGRAHLLGLNFETVKGIKSESTFSYNFKTLYDFQSSQIGIYYLLK